MKTMKTIKLILGLLIITTLLPACKRETEAPVVVEKAVMATVVVQEEVEQAAPAAAATAVVSKGGGAVDAVNIPAGRRMVIKDAEMEILVQDTDRTVNQITQMAADYGGYLISSRTWFVESYKFAELRLGVPSDDFERAMTYLRQVGIQVVRETASGQDVSAEYADLESRLKNLEATADRVRAFLKDAKTVEESLKINDTLSQLEGQIEQVKGQMQYYEGRAAFSTITVFITPQYPTPTPTLTPTPTVTPTPTEGWNPGKTVERAGKATVSVLQFTFDALIWVIFIFGPFALVAVLIFFVVRYFWRRSRKKKAA